MSTSTTAKTWPTLASVRDVLEQFGDADHALDSMAISCHGLVDREDPWEPPADVPTPTAEDVAALAVLCEGVANEIADMQRRLGDMEQLRQVATFRFRTDEGGGNA